MEYESLDIGIDRTAHELDGVLHKCLVFGMTDACRTDSVSIMFGKCREVIVYHWFVAVVMCHCGLQVVRDDRYRNPSIEVQGVLACLCEVFLRWDQMALQYA